MFDKPDKLGVTEWNPSMGRYDLVTFTFGGDNLGFASIIEQCVGLSSLVADGENAATGDLDSTVSPAALGPGA